MPFVPDVPVEVREIPLPCGKVEWELLRELRYVGGDGDVFVVPVHSCTDFASVPVLVAWLLPRYGEWTRPAILHDQLWRCEVPRGRVTRAEADAIFRRAMREEGVSFLRRWFMWGGVRLGDLPEPSGGLLRWVRDSWQLGPLVVIAFPIVGPPAVLILVGLGLFHTAESVAWVILLLLRSVRARFGTPRPVKEVNPPTLNLRTA